MGTAVLVRVEARTRGMHIRGVDMVVGPGPERVSVARVKVGLVGLRCGRCW